MTTSEALFREAFEQIGLAAGQAAQLPDHRERPQERPSVTTQSPAAEVTVTVHDGKVEGLRFDPMWFEGQTPDDAAILIVRTLNKAYDAWAKKELENLTEITPDVKELYGALGAARAKRDEAWVRGIAEAKS